MVLHISLLMQPQTPPPRERQLQLPLLLTSRVQAIQLQMPPTPQPPFFPSLRSGTSSSIDLRASRPQKPPIARLPRTLNFKVRPCASSTGPRRPPQRCPLEEVLVVLHSWARKQRRLHRQCRPSSWVDPCCSHTNYTAPQIITTTTHNIRPRDRLVVEGHRPPLTAHLTSPSCFS